MTWASSASTARLATSVAVTSASMPSRWSARSALTLRIADVPMPAPQIVTIFIAALSWSCDRGRCGGASDAGLVEAGADPVGELLTVLDGEERGRRGVELEHLEIREVVAERVDEKRELLREGRVAHQPIVGVDGDAEAELVEQVERMVDELVTPGHDRARLQVRRGRQLQRDLPVLHPVRKAAEAHPGVVVVLALDGDVEGQPHAVAEAEGAPVEEGARDAVQVGRLAGVDGDREPVLGEQVEGVTQAAGREARLRTRDVEADDALPAVAERQLGDLEAAVVLAHGGDELADRDLPAGAEPHILDAGLDALLHGLDRLIESQPSGQV